ncbi:MULTISPECIES: M3 family metallopeptidase [unclassified Corynebacterium]|uniref:M3 family metallopeptidase n=1 Tax=unclassified Corynebacterium TaxID=2624378 RepID=UPI0021681A2F|nr:MULTISPECIES: M3 family metallopeptidase [unclassified Corynebacterium]MCS4490561.1 M3 family metallopeptidase [Corynebacterium sp. ES2775-CONJ]MCS4492340.1 M3 family metallopeptidase [Corynebacterium sp. ES2715-CONJ3]
MSEYNPLLVPSTLPYQLPPFADIKTEHFQPAFAAAIAEHDAEITAIATNEDPATWDNTVEAWEKSGRNLERVAAVFFNLLGTDSTTELEDIAATVAPQLAAHTDAIFLNAQLYQRLKDVQVPVAPESQRLFDHLMRQFTRRGINLSADKQQRLKEINAQLSSLSERFNSELRKSTTQDAPTFDREDLRGLDEATIQSARHYAQDLGREGYVLPLELPTAQSALSHLESPTVRATLYEASKNRGASNAETVIKTVQLRAERAALLGYDNHAEYVIAEETAPDSHAASQLLSDLAPAAATNARNEFKLLHEAADLDSESDHGATIGAADWPYWETYIRHRDYHLDETELKKYFPLSRVVNDGLFYAASRLYGITVQPRPDLVAYHPDVKIYEILEENGEGIGLVLTDYFARPSKRGGAWMSSFVDQSELLGDKPVVVNVLNINKPVDGSDPLLSLDEVTTLFHEFGHGLHGLFSQVKYPTFSGTRVPRDYVEFPSQINENWAFDDAILSHYAFHIDTGEPLPTQMREAMTKAQQFGQGCATSEYLASAIIDLAWHSLSPDEAHKLRPEDIAEFERQALAKAGLEVAHLAPRYGSLYFAHIFAGGYSAGYYSYLWAEVLDADGFDWFTECHAAGAHAGDAAARQAGQKFRDLVLSRGGADDYHEAFIKLRGREKDITPLLRRRGLAGSL